VPKLGLGVRARAGRQSGHTFQMALDLTQPRSLGVHVLSRAQAAPACGIVPALEAALAENISALGTELYVVDYRLSVLQPVSSASKKPIGSAERLGVDESAVGRVFVTQLPEVTLQGECFAARLPVTVRGERLGVLEVLLPSRPSDDQLGELQGVATDLAHAICVARRDTDVFERAARAQALSLAAEMQWQLLPGRASAGPGYRLAGQLEPAYYVAGDSFDWCVSHECTQLSLCDAMGRGVTASQLATLAVSALRNGRRNDISLAEQARCADQAIYSLHCGEQFAHAVLLRFDHSSNKAYAVSAGSAFVLRQRGEDVVPLALKAQLPLGLFEGTDYTEQPLDAVPGDRIVVASDGLYSACPPGGAEFGSARLFELLASMKELPPAEVVRRLIKELLAYHRGASLRDDAVVVVFDWLPLPAGASPCQQEPSMSGQPS